jgi:GxxExxY protein
MRLATQTAMPLVSTPLARAVIGCAIQVHRTLGPGLLESAYKKCIEYEFIKRGIFFRREVLLPVVYDGVQLDCGYRLDLLSEDVMILEAKSVEVLLPVYSSQVLTQLRISGVRQALLINFNVAVLKDGIKSFLWTPPGETKPLVRADEGKRIVLASELCESEKD